MMLTVHREHSKKTHSALQPEGSKQRLGHSCFYKMLMTPAVGKWQNSSQSQEKETNSEENESIFNLLPSRFYT